MSSQLAQLQEAAIKQHCKTLRMPMMASQFSTLAEQAVREKKTHTGYLEVLLTAEIEERERNTIERRIKEAHLPRVKTLEEFDYTQTPLVTASKMRDLAEGGYIERAHGGYFGARDLFDGWVGLGGDVPAFGIDPVRAASHLDAARGVGLHYDVDQGNFGGGKTTPDEHRDGAGPCTVGGAGFVGFDGCNLEDLGRWGWRRWGLAKQSGGGDCGD